MTLEKYKDLKIHFSASDNSGCSYYRSFLPSEYLKQTIPTIKYTEGFQVGDEDRDNYDVYFMQRINHQFFIDWIPAMQARGKKFIYDLDDTLWNIPATNMAHVHYGREELKRVEKCISLCDAVVTTTVPLQEQLLKFNDKVMIIPNFISNTFDFRDNQNEIPKIGWGGTYTHNGDFNSKLVFYLQELVKQKKIELIMMGFTPKFFKNFATSVPWSESKEYHNNLNSQNIDIGIIVTEDNTFNRCKSNIKFLEYSACSIYSIADNVYPYKNTITGDTGRLVLNPKTDWREYINEAIKNPELRLQTVKNANEYVKSLFTYAHNGNTIDYKYESLFDYLYEGIWPEK